MYEMYYDELKPTEVLVHTDGQGVWVPLVPGLHPDACDDCVAGRHVGYNHPECETLVPAPLGAEVRHGWVCRLTKAKSLSFQACRVTSLAARESQSTPRGWASRPRAKRVSRPSAKRSVRLGDRCGLARATCRGLATFSRRAG